MTGRLEDSLERCRDVEFERDEALQQTRQQRLYQTEPRRSSRGPDALPRHATTYHDAPRAAPRSRGPERGEPLSATRRLGLQCLDAEPVTRVRTTYSDDVDMRRYQQQLSDFRSRR